MPRSVLLLSLLAFPLVSATAAPTAAPTGAESPRAAPANDAGTAHTAAGIPIYSLTMAEAETQALAASSALKAAEAEARGAARLAGSASAVLFPKLSLDGSYRYQTVVPEIQVGPTAMPLGDNRTYSLGPTVQWLAWDSGLSYHRWTSAKAQARARAADADALKRSATLDARLAYLAVQRALEQMRLLGDGVRVSAAQYADIRSREKAGAGTRMDALAAHQELLSRERQLRRAQTELASALRTLFQKTGAGDGINADLPVAGENLASWPAGWGRPTLIVRLDPIGESASRLALPASAELDLDHPSILALAERARAARDAARAAEGGHGPTLSLAGRVSRDYPNGPIHETITQKTASASASWPLFEFGRVKNEAASYREQAAAGEALRDDRVTALKAEWATGKDRLRGLWSEQAINKASLDESAELAKITYKAYLNGGANHVQVETANLRELEARVFFAETEAQIAIELAILNSLAKATEELAFRFDQ